MNSEKITYNVIKAGHDLDTIVVKSGGKEYPLHSKVNPARDSELLAEKFEPSRYDFLIILGVGLGYHCLPLKDMVDKYSRVILVDILDGIDGDIRKNRLTSFLLSNPRITLVTGKSANEVESLLSECINMDSIRGISVLEHPASVRIFSGYYDTIKKSIDKIINSKASNKATRKAFGARYLRNILLNFSMMNTLHPVRYLFRAFKPYPVIIAGSGPSLDCDVDAMAQYQERFFIIAVDSAFSVLQMKGINPDIVISIDPQPYVYEHFLNCDLKNAMAVHSISSHPSLVQALKGYLSFNSHPFSQLASEVYGGLVGSVDSATGSVAGDAVSLAIQCGFSGIGITGLDFSFPGFAIYARGTSYQKRYGMFFHDRFSTVEGLNMKYIMSSSGGISHGGKFTRKSFLHYHQALEDFIRDRAVSDIVSLNDRGIALAGTVRMDMDEFIRRYCADIIDKKGVIDTIKGASQIIGGEPLAEAIIRNIDGQLFDDLLDASLGSEVDNRVKRKYRDLALLVNRSLIGK